VRFASWRELGASEYLLRAIQFGIGEPPSTPFTGVGAEMGEVPQTDEDLKFGRADLQVGLQKVSTRS
jgi:hypothetical protein